ncbi:MAG: hypothetical protein ABI895_27435 [Deltaproteobacteria bacterium]
MRVYESATGEMLGELAGDGAWPNLELRCHSGFVEEPERALEVLLRRSARNEHLIKKRVRDTRSRASTHMLGFEVPGRTRVASYVSHHVHAPAQVLELGVLDL